MTEPSIHSIALHSTSMGSMWSHWSDRGLFRLDWNPPSDPIGVVSRVQTRVDSLDALLETFYETGDVSFDSVSVDPTGWTPFSSRVYQCCREINPGHTLTYKQLAEAAGSDGASRAVGAAMARNRVVLVIPCHRVVSTNGGLGGFSAPGGLATKRSLLDLERAGRSPLPLSLAR